MILSSGFERATIQSKSFLLALALMKRQINVEDAARAARVESIAQSKLWGEVEDTHDVDQEDMVATLGSALFIGTVV